jgi:hypothetical protein
MYVSTIMGFAVGSVALLFSTASSIEVVLFLQCHRLFSEDAALNIGMLAPRNHGVAVVSGGT